MAIAGFPEGHPHIPDAVLNEALEAKVRFARPDSLPLSIITQFSFRSEPVIEWVQRVRARGLDLPIRVGLAGPAGLLTLMRHGVRCGTGKSLRVLSENPSFAKVLVERGPEPIIAGLAAFIADDNGQSLGIRGRHFHIFAGLRRLMDWIAAEGWLKALSHPTGTVRQPWA